MWSSPPLDSGAVETRSLEWWITLNHLAVRRIHLGLTDARIKLPGPMHSANCKAVWSRVFPSNTEGIFLCSSKGYQSGRESEVSDSSIGYLCLSTRRCPRPNLLMCRFYIRLRSRSDTVHPWSSWSLAALAAGASRVWTGHPGDSRTNYETQLEFHFIFRNLDIFIFIV